MSLVTERDSYWSVESQAIWMHIAPRGAHMPQLALQQYSPVPQVFLPHWIGVTLGSQAQTLGEGFQTVPYAHGGGIVGHWQTPPQSAPPLVGSQSSVGSSTHWPMPGHLMPAIPPHWTGGTGSGTQTPTGGQGAAKHSTTFGSQ